MGTALHGEEGVVGRCRQRGSYELAGVLILLVYVARVEPIPLTACLHQLLC